MRTLTIAGNQAKWFAGATAIFAAAVAIGGPLSLAEHYARTGATAPTANELLVQQRAQLTCRST